MNPADHERRHRSDEGQGIAERSMRERVPVDELKLRDTDIEKADELRAAAKKKLLAMAGYTEEKAEEELAPVASKAAAMEASPKKEELSEANAEFLADPKREAEYEARLKTLTEEEAKGMPSFLELMAPLKGKSNETLDALRVRTEDLRFAVAIIRDEEGKIIAYRPGLIEATAEPEFLRNSSNPQNLAGKHYDKVHGALSPHGLRSPEFSEYEALFAMRKQMDGVLIDTKDWALLNMGERTDKSASVPVAGGDCGKPSQGSSGPAYPRDRLVSRPSTWGDNVPPKTA